MKIGPKFKIAKRLGAPVFEKTQTQKFALSEARAGKRRTKRPRQVSDYSKQLTEKQKMRYTYGITEKQLRRYVDEAVSKSNQPINLLMERLESRLDNVVYRLGLAKTRQASRQMVAHGHIFVNGRRLGIPSHRTRVGDVITVREGSKGSGLFQTIVEDHSAAGVPSWLTFDLKKLSGEKKSEPTYVPSETLFDPELILEYYSR
ncbi:30S ribosomal protein S4 [Candidatus Parcubacteria bacterium]|uniref:Small ribosomal subunit protein uS4 n=1 Tax=Candidatus Kaiserbacteria bacterium CG10_big_fil_rev_8_21_14_0_10_47_16 TaxID=1974608 RepID=A0A2H0UED5_9BACT|nr:30S ribosomal protein S4 [Candidatus Parcubacteria bacterium]PIR84769.1 MAG: 30S ribosomal protein S4 [Candidatus Kaiserbacteria bacterium CG10_big_fil_rev_8_21_14_0_10_47_16]